MSASLQWSNHSCMIYVLKKKLQSIKTVCKVQGATGYNRRRRRRWNKNICISPWWLSKWSCLISALIGAYISFSCPILYHRHRTLHICLLHFCNLAVWHQFCKTRSSCIGMWVRWVQHFSHQFYLLHQCLAYALYRYGYEHTKSLSVGFFFFLLLLCLLQKRMKKRWRGIEEK